MGRLLVRSSGDWGDEFDLEGFMLVNKDTWEEIKAGIPDESFEAYFGSNEFVVFDGKDEYLSHIKEIEISLEDEAKLLSLLGLKKRSDDAIITYGLFVIRSSNY